MLYHSDTSFSGWNLGLSVSLWWPPDTRMSAEVYVEWLRQGYRDSPGPMLNQAREVVQKDVTLVGPSPYVEIAYSAIVAVARRQGWDIDGGRRPAHSTNWRGAYKTPPQ